MQNLFQIALTLKLVLFFLNFINPLIIESNLICKTTEECEFKKIDEIICNIQCKNGTEVKFIKNKNDSSMVGIVTKELTKNSGISSLPELELFLLINTHIGNFSQHLLKGIKLYFLINIYKSK